MVKRASIATKAILVPVLIALGFVLAPVARAADYANKLPRIVFVPGILGSAIAECNSSDKSMCSRCFDGSPHKECKIIWGPKGSPVSTLLNLETTDLHLDPTKHYVASPIDEMAWNKVYYDIIMSLKNLSPEANLYHPFGYDWRRSVVENAGSLSKFVCDLQQKYPEAPIYIVAHSMGGLVVRYWLDLSSEKKCANGVNLKVLEVLYVATPHRGSVKAVLSLLSGFRYFLDDSWYAPLNGLFSPLNKAGPTFQSLYELFPVQASAECQREVKALQSQLDDAPVQLRDSTEGIDIFNPVIWSDFSLYSALIAVSEMKDPQGRLPERLTRAAKEACELEKRNSSASRKTS